ncbi:MAG: DUF1549 domain-containing protein [Candidatus Solibacter usitatus]|nr:DUF1549 domain-containing protein [Candidatus Solibacter usitatus]
MRRECQLGNRRAGAIGLLPVLLAAPLAAQDSEFFEKNIRPVLAAQCYACHSSKLKSPMGGLVLDTQAGLRQGGVSGPAVKPGKPEESRLLNAIRYGDARLKMPPSGRLPDSVIAGFEHWIASGAPDPRQDSAGASPARRQVDAQEIEKGRQWWAFQPARDLPAPVVRNGAWPHARIDSFVLAKLEQAGLKPSPAADPRTLIRRVYLDLTGLKPGYEEVEDFARDPSPGRYERLVERLLESHRYGERWGR